MDLGLYYYPSQTRNGLNALFGLKTEEKYFVAFGSQNLKTCQTSNVLKSIAFASQQKKCRSRNEAKAIGCGPQQDKTETNWDPRP